MARLDHVFVGSWDAHPNSSCSILSGSLAFNQPKEEIWTSDHLGVVVDTEVRKDAEGRLQ